MCNGSYSPPTDFFVDGGAQWRIPRAGGRVLTSKKRWRPRRVTLCLPRGPPKAPRRQTRYTAKFPIDYDEFLTHGGPDHIFVLSETIKYRARQNKKTYTAFLDIRKAYPTMHRATMLNALAKAGINGYVWRLVDRMYSSTTSQLKLGTCSCINVSY